MSFFDFFQRMTGQQPLMSAQPNQPQAPFTTMPQIQADDYRDAAMSKMGQLGMLLVAAGQRMTPRERATILAQAPQYMDGVQRDAMTAAQARLMNIQGQNAQQEIEHRNTLMERMKTDPGFVDRLGIPKEALSVLSPDLLEKAVAQKVTQDPLDHQIKLAQIAAASKPEWKITGQTEFGQPKYDLVSPDGSIITPQDSNNRSNGGSTVMDSVRGLSGTAVVDKLKETNPGLASQVEAIASGRVPFSTTMMKGPRGEMLEALVNMVDPNYSTTTFDTRKKTATGFASSTPGSAGGQVVFGNTAIKHLLELRKEVDNLRNYQGFPGSYYVNKIGNASRESSGRSSDLTRWKATSQNAADEIAKFYGAGGVEDRAKIAALFDPARGPDELRAVIDEQIKDLFAKTSNLENQYKEGMGPYAGNKKIIYDDTAEELLKTYKKPDQQELPPGVSIRRVN